jgi:hypothetical protein
VSLALASENLEPGHGQTVGFGLTRLKLALGRDFSEALALALLNPKPSQSHLEPKPEKAKAEPKSRGAGGQCQNNASSWCSYKHNSS